MLIVSDMEPIRSGLDEAAFSQLQNLCMGSAKYHVCLCIEFGTFGTCDSMFAVFLEPDV